MTFGRIGNLSNMHQGEYRKVLCVCTGGLLRSPTAAVVLSQDPFHFNTRSAGTDPNYALNKVDNLLLMWCDEIVVMEKEHEVVIGNMLTGLGSFGKKPIVNLDIPDQYPYRDPRLMEMISVRYQKLVWQKEVL